MMFTKFLRMATVMVGTCSFLALAITLPGGREDLLKIDHPVDESPIKGYAVVTPMISGSLMGKKFQLNGTVEEVFTQLEKVHNIKNLTSTDGETYDEAAFLAKRNKLPPPICFTRNYATVPGTNQCIKHLERIQGTSTVRGRSCARLTCFGGASIWLCNDNNWTISPNNIYLASYARDIKNRCYSIRAFEPTYTTGQLFDSDRYNIIVQSSAC